MNLVILGPPGSGKGTQAELLEDRFDLEHIDIGLCLRQVTQGKTELGKLVDVHVNERKDLVPVEIVMSVLKNAIKESPKLKGIILDGAPRRMDQIRGVEDAFAQNDRKIDKIIHLHATENVVVERIQNRYRCPQCYKYYILGKTIGSDRICSVCSVEVKKRKDDTTEGVKKRLHVYDRSTLPVIEHYRKAGRLLEIDAGMDSSSVFNKIINSIEKDIV